MTALPDEFIVDFDRKEIGNATYFQGIENSLLDRGQIEGNSERTLYPARIFVKPYDPIPNLGRPALSIDLLDFAGRHFTSMADLKRLLEKSDKDSDENKALREVNETLEKADAYIILISTAEIDPGEEIPQRTPFTPSVNFLLTHCRDQRKPVALLFSQEDRTPKLTEKLFREIPRVQEFERKFTSNHEEYLAKGRPFGIVKRISCYVAGEDDRPRRQSLGNIWRPEPAEVVIELLRAAMPQIRKRLADDAAKIELDKREQENEEHRQWRRVLALRIAVAIGIATLLALLVFAYFWREGSEQVRVLSGAEAILREGQLASMSEDLERRLAEILADYRAHPDQTASRVGAAIRDLDPALYEAARRLTEKPSLEAAYAEELRRLQKLVSEFDPAVAARWPPALAPALEARSAFLSDWLGTARPDRRERIRTLDQAAKRFRDASDSAFSIALAERSTQVKGEEVASWQERINADADVQSRLGTIQSLLASVSSKEDPELSRLARKALAGHLATTLLQRQENGLLRERLLQPQVADLAPLADGQVRFDVLAERLASCPDPGDCQSRRTSVEAVLDEANTASTSWSAGVENVLRSLLLDLSVEGRREIWEALAEALRGAYLFSPRPDAWPEGIQPLPDGILPTSGDEIDSTASLIERIGRRPIYDGELRYLSDRLALTAAQRQAVPLYAEIREALTGGASELPTEKLEEIRDQLPESNVSGGMPGPLSELRGELGSSINLAEKVTAERSKAFGDPAAEGQLDRLLKDALRRYCAALDPAPQLGCADAG
jgi:hypothetical protein